MKIFLAGTQTCKLIRARSLFCLDSYIEYRGTKRDKEFHMPTACEDFMLDSGLFTFMNSKPDVVMKLKDWYDYADRYGEFVKKNKIKKYVELDIDYAYPLDDVLRLRKYLEGIVGWKCMPAYHPSRGKKNLLDTMDNYEWFCAGGLVTGGNKRLGTMMLPYIIDEAHRRHCKVHGLGFTRTSMLDKYHFDSVDSTSWLAFSQYGNAYQFDGTKMAGVQKPDNALVRDFKEEANAVGLPHMKYKHYLQGLEWLKYQKYAKECL